MSGSRRDLLRLVRQRGGARPRGRGGPARMVASGDAPALKARHDAPDPHRRADARRRAGRDRRRHERRAADGAGRARRWPRPPIASPGRCRRWSCAGRATMAATAMSRRGTSQARGVAVRVAATCRAEERGREMGARRNGTARSRRCRRRPTPRAAADRCLFGTGLKRGLDERVSQQLLRLCDAALVAVACDLPSGVDSDSGAELSAVPPIRPDRDLRRAEARAPAASRRCTNAAGSCSPTSASSARATGTRSRRPTPAAARSRRPQIRPRTGPCAGRQDAGRDRARGDGGGASGRGLCPGQHVAADRRPAARRSSRSTPPRSTTRGSAACWSARAWATFRRC